MTKPLPAWPFLLTALALAGCGHSPPTQFFTLDAAPPASTAAYAGPAVRVDQVQIPSTLDRPEIVHEYAAGQLKVDDFNHWGAPLGQLMRATLAEDIAARTSTGTLVPAAGPKPTGTVGLSVEILSVANAAPGMTMDVVWTQTLVTPAQKGQAAPQAATLSHTVRLSSSESTATPQSYAAGLSRMMGDLADRMVSELNRPPQ